MTTPLVADPSTLGGSPASTAMSASPTTTSAIADATAATDIPTTRPSSTSRPPPPPPPTSSSATTSATPAPTTTTTTTITDTPTAVTAMDSSLASAPVLISSSRVPPPPPSFTAISSLPTAPLLPLLASKSNATDEGDSEAESEDDEESKTPRFGVAIEDAEEEEETKYSDKPPLKFSACDFSELLDRQNGLYKEDTREWVFDSIKDFIHSDNRMFWLMGAAGTGKTVIAAQLRQLTDVKIIAWHFCRHDNIVQSDFRVILQSWFVMLRDALDRFDYPSEMTNSGISEMFDNYICDPLSQQPDDSGPCVILLDGLDELPLEYLNPVLKIVTDAIEKLPDFVKVFISSRDDPFISQRLLKYNPIVVQLDSDERSAMDLNVYCTDVVKTHVNLDFKLSQLEVTLEKQFSLAEGTLAGKLAPLQHHVNKAAEIFEAASMKNRADEGYEVLCDTCETIPPVFEPETDVNLLYQDVVEAHTILRSLFAAEWADYKTVDGKPTSWQVPAPGVAVAWVNDVIDYGLIDQETFIQKIATEGDEIKAQSVVKFLVICSTPVQMDEALTSLEDYLAFEDRMGLKNRYANPDPLGYQCFHLSFNLSLQYERSYLCEVQVVLRSMLEAKETAQIHLQQICSEVPRICKEAGIHEEKKFEEALMTALYSPVLYPTAQILQTKAGSSFLHASLLRRQLEDEGKRVDIPSLQHLCGSIEESYKKLRFDRIGSNTSQWSSYRTVIAMMMVAREPLLETFVQLGDLCSQLAPWFSLSKDKRLTVSHRTLMDWLRSPANSEYHISEADLKTAHSTLADKLLSQLADINSDIPPQDSPQKIYAFLHVIHHLCESERAQEALSLLTNISWLLVRVQLFDVETLIGDTTRVAHVLNNRLLRLLASALKHAANIIRTDWRFLPAQLVGRLIGYQKDDKDVAGLLHSVRQWEGPADGRGWWCPTHPTLAPAGGADLLQCAHSEDVACAEWSPDGNFICTGSDNLLWLWHAHTGKLLKIFAGHANRVNSLSWSPDGKQICSGSFDETVRVWNVADGACVHTLEHSDKVVFVAWKQNNIFSRCPKEMRIWNADTKSEQKISREKTITGVSFTPTGQISILDADGVWVWEGEGWGTRVVEGKYLAAISWSEDGRLATGQIGAVKVWQKTDADKKDEGEQKTESDFICTRKFTLNNFIHVWLVAWIGKDTICSASSDHLISIWNVATGTLVKTLTGHTERIMTLSCRPDGRVCSGGMDEILRVFDVAQVPCNDALQNRDVMEISWSADGRVCSKADRCSPRIWELETGVFLDVEHPPGVDVCAFAWAPDGRLATGGSDHLVRVWDKSGALLTTLNGHTDRVTAVAWGGNTRLCSGSLDVTVRIWDVEQKTQIQVFAGWLLACDYPKLCLMPVNRKVQVVDLVTEEIVELEFDAKYLDVSRLLVSWINQDRIGVYQPNGYSFYMNSSRHCPLRVFDLKSGAHVWKGSGFPPVKPLVSLWRPFGDLAALPLGVDADMRYCACPTNPRRILAQVSSDDGSLHVLQLLGNVKQMYVLPATELPAEVFAVQPTRAPQVTSNSVASTDTAAGGTQNVSD